MMDQTSHSVVEDPLRVHRHESSRVIEKWAPPQKPVTNLASLFEAKAALRDRAAIVFHQEGTLPPVYCVPGLLGWDAFVGLIAEHLEPERPVLALQAHSLATGAPDFPDSIAAIAEDYLTTVRQHQSAGPYHLIGWCSGSFIVFEMAMRLLAEREEVARLILIDPPVPPISEASAARVRQQIAALRKVQLGSEAARAYRDAVARTMSTIGRAIRAYYPNPYPNELVILYSGEQSAALTAETSAWRQAAKGPLKIAEIAPTNSSMIREHLPRLGAYIRGLLK